MRVLVVEDEAGLRRQLQALFGAHGIEATTTTSGREAVYLATEYPFDMLVVDLGLPDLSGLEVIRTLRERQHDMPILIITARGGWQHKVDGLDAGADDYLTKPYQPEELLARIRALMRRHYQLPAGRMVLEHGPLVIDLDQQAATLDGVPLDLTHFEFQLLGYLARNAGRVLGKDRLSDYLHAGEEDRDSNVIEVLISRLRRKLDPDGRLQPIETVRGHGYRYRLGRS